MRFKRILLLVPAFLLVTGCVTATQLQQELDPIRQQAASLEERVSALEGRVSALENRADATDARIENISLTTPEDVEMIEEMTKRAEDAADKSERAFIMQQKKGM